jgi:hypothetical protein
VWAAPELLGAPTIGGGGGAWPGGGGGEIHRSHICIPSQPYEIAKNGEKRAVSRTFWPINCQKRRFLL